MLTFRITTHAQPTLSLEGQVALITGGSRGIGAAAVRMFVQAGARVVFNYVRARDAADNWCRSAARNLSRRAGRPERHRRRGRVGTRSCRALGSLDAVVVNHGIWSAEEIDIDKMTDEHWRTTIAVNLDSAFAVVKHAVAQMKRQDRGGNVVLVSSTAGQRGESGHCDYAATKGALISMTKGLSTELAPHRIHVNCVAPGWVETDMTTGTLGDAERRKKIYATIPLGRVGTPEEIAAPILFLCTKYASFITGEVFNVNGGAVLVG